MTKIPSDEILESLYKVRIHQSAQLKNVLELFDMEIHQKTSVPNCQKLKTMVKRCKDQKLRLRNFDARHGRIESGAAVKSRKGTIGVEGGKGICYQWKEQGQCSQGDRCSFRHETQDRAQKPEQTHCRHTFRASPFTRWKCVEERDEILESLCKLRIRESAQLKNVLELYDMEIHQKTSVPNYQKLKTMVKRCFDQKLRLRNFDARHGRIESGASVKSRKGTIGVEGGWKEQGQCSQGDRCSFRHETQDRAQKPEHTAATPSEPAPSPGRSVSRKRKYRQPCRYYLKGTCTRTPCGYWHPPECQFYKQKRVVSQKTRVCFLITRLMNNQIHGRRKATSQKEENVKTKALWPL